MPDADKSRRQYMSCKPAKELHPTQGELFFLSYIPIVLIMKRNCFFIDICESVIGYGNLVGVSAQVFYDCFGRSKWSLGIDYPFGFEGLPGNVLWHNYFFAQLSHELSPEYST